MRKLIVIAALLTASSASAGDTVSFELGGHQVRFDAADECTIDNLDSCLTLSITEIKPPSANPAPGAAPLQIKPLPPNVSATKPVVAKPKVAAVTPAPAVAAHALPSRAVASHTATTAPAPMEPAPVAAKPAAPEPRLAAAPSAPTPVVPQPEAKPAVTPTPAAAPAQMASLAPKQQMLTQPSAPASPSPLGVWQTEEKEGKIRIEPCGTNLCGYAIIAATNQNGTQILINMKPASGKWSGRIHDPNTGSDYDSTIALKGTDSLKVQGCALGGWVCGGQTWTRLN